jgi:hypothetical protein
VACSPNRPVRGCLGLCDTPRDGRLAVGQARRCACRYLGMMVANAIRTRLRPAPPDRSAAIAAPPARPQLVGIEYLIEAAGGEQALIRAAARRLPRGRVFSNATPIEASEALAITLVERAPQAIAQLGDSAWEVAHEAARLVAKAAGAPRNY